MVSVPTTTDFNRTVPAVCQRIVAALFVWLWLIANAHAATIEPVSESYMSRLADHRLTLDLESELATALDKKNVQAVVALARRVEKQDGLPINTIPTLTTDQQSMIALRLGPCHYAGLTIRFIVKGLADKTIRSSRKYGVHTTSPGDLDDLFVENIRRCEVVKRYPVTKRTVGTKCVVDGTQCDEKD